MRQRVIMAVVALILFIPVIFVGGVTLDIVGHAVRGPLR